MPALIALTYCLTGGPTCQPASAQTIIKTAQLRAQPAAAQSKSAASSDAASATTSAELRERAEPSLPVPQPERVKASLVKGKSALSAPPMAAPQTAMPVPVGADPVADLAALDWAERNVAGGDSLALETDATDAAADDSLELEAELLNRKLAEEPTSDSNILDGRTVACQAAACWPLAKLLEQRAATLLADARHCSEAEQRSAALQAKFLRRQAARQRDIAAANALRTYYSWIANRDQLALVAEGYELQKEQVATQHALIGRGVAVGDPTALERKRLELRDNEIQLQANDRRLAQTLLQLTCCASDLHSVTVEALEIRATELPCDRLVAFALEHRQDYLALVELCRCLDKQTARSIAAILTPLAGGVGLKALDLNCLEKLVIAMHGADALNQIQRELRSATDMQRRLIEQTVCEKCLALTTAYQRVEIAQQLLSTWDERIATLNRLGELGEARGEELVTARSEQLKARSTLLERQLAAKLAEVDLADAMGGLAPRCCRGEPWLITLY